MDCCARMSSDSSSGTPLDSRSESWVKVSASTSLFTRRCQGNRRLRSPAAACGLDPQGKQRLLRQQRNRFAPTSGRDHTGRILPLNAASRVGEFRHR